MWVLYICGCNVLIIFYMTFYKLVFLLCVLLLPCVLYVWRRCGVCCGVNRGYFIVGRGYGC